MATKDINDRLELRSLAFRAAKLMLDSIDCAVEKEAKGSISDMLRKVSGSEGAPEIGKRNTQAIAYLTLSAISHTISLAVTIGDRSALMAINAAGHRILQRMERKQ